MFHGAGVRVTLASDAHHPEEAGYAHDEVVEAARAAGYSHHLRFDSRQGFDVPLVSSIEAS
jgi:histidinol phosphatase-like PHP family hydrolase